MKDRKNKKGSGLFIKISIPLAVVLIVQTVILLTIVQYLAISGLKENTQQVVMERVSSRKTEIETTILTKWTNLDLAVEQIDELYETFSEADKDIWAEDTQAEFLLASYDTLTSVLRQSATNGVFLILNDSPDFSKYTTDAKRLGLGLRDYDSESSYLNTEDLLTIRSPARIVLQLCTTDTWWENTYTFYSEKQSSFFYRPLEQAYANPNVDSKLLGYFSDPYILGTEYGIEVVSYSIPLVYNGQPYGVLGTEISTKYLAELLPKDELGDPQSSAYALAKVVGEENEFEIFAKSGSFFTQAFGSAEIIKRSESLADDTYYFENNSKSGEAIGFVSKISLYDNNSPFDTFDLAIIGFVNENTLFSSINRFNMIFIIVSIVTFIAGLCAVIVFSKVITNPITKLAKNVEHYDVEGDVELDRIGIKEIDGLVSAIEQMHKRMVENLAKTEFFARMSHDMRTPMNAIIGFSDEEIIKNASADDRENYFAKINVSGKYLLALINDVLDMSKISSGKLSLFLVGMRFEEFWKSTLPIIEEVSMKKGVSFIVEGLDETQKELVLNIDKYRMQQIFTNLLSNAVKFTQKGGEVRFSVRELSADDNTVTFEYRISDTGCGMTEDFMKKLYKPFQQERPGDGTGLGLSISKKLIDMLQGNISCVSEVGKGTVFTVTLTHEISKAEESAQTTAKPTPHANTLKGKRVLLCEDNEINTEIAKIQLEDREMLVEHAVDGVEAIEKFESSPVGYFDIVLMDIQMPRKNGFEATKAIRALDRVDGKTVPIVAMTANTFAEDVIASKQAGMNDHLAKPIDRALLYSTLENLIS